MLISRHSRKNWTTVSTDIKTAFTTVLFKENNTVESYVELFADDKLRFLSEYQS